MCGIAGIILKHTSNFNLAEKIVSMSGALAHRGPDGEGFMLANKEHAIPFYSSLKQNYERQDLSYIPEKHISSAPENSFLAFAHRRLAIIDLHETGHQPMNATNLWISFNGEVYNYIELRDELKLLGHRFVSESDTEVVLAAYREWGTDCVQKFNGMWAFCIFDTEKQICFASRDRFGVKPFYYLNNKTIFAFASEQKAFIKSGLASAKIYQKALHDYLINTLLERETTNFFEEISELFPGNNLIYDLRTHEIKITPYYHLSAHLDLENDNLSEEQLIGKISSTFENAVKLRLRSDVEVGTCLSGGIDSSALAVSMATFTRNTIYCFTSVFRNNTINEEFFADAVAKKIHAKHIKVEPTFEGFLKEADDLIYSQDVPIWDTSTYAQYKVMELAKQNNIKVVLDGQGADEIFAGYHHHFTAKWNNLFSRGNFFEALKDIQASNKTIPNAFKFYVAERLKQKHYFNQKEFSFFFKNDFIHSGNIRNPSTYFDGVNAQLMNDIYDTRLKTFLKCEDRCGMWHSVESRTPFSDDVDLVNLLFSFNGNKKMKQGISKYFLREAVKDKLPNEVYTRYDKKGFETPMQQWVQTLHPHLISEIKKSNFEFVDYKKLEKTNPKNAFHNKLLFKLFVLSRWKHVFEK